jgi:hypothetical protein
MTFSDAPIALKEFRKTPWKFQQPNCLASSYADHKFSNLAALFPANADPGLARLILEQTVNRFVAELFASRIRY